MLWLILIVFHNERIRLKDPFQMRRQPDQNTKALHQTIGPNFWSTCLVDFFGQFLFLKSGLSFYSGFRRKVRVRKCKPLFVVKSGGHGPRRSMRRPRTLGTRTRHCLLMTECYDCMWLLLLLFRTLQ